MDAKELVELATTIIADCNNHRRGAEYDAVPLAECVLANVRADDDEPVTEEWFRQIDWIETGDGGFRNPKAMIHPSRLVSWEYSQGIYVRGWQLSKLKTRGGVRRLCKALGIELKESA